MRAATRTWTLGCCFLGAIALPSCPATAKSIGCDGIFRQASSGFLFSEGGLEPTDAPRKVGESVHFVGFDLDRGQRYFVSETQEVLYPAADVALEKGCQLHRMTKY